MTTPKMDRLCIAPVVSNSNVPASKLTKREMMAMNFMTAWINHHAVKNDYGFCNETAAQHAVESADELLKALDK